MVINRAIYKTVVTVFSSCVFSFCASSIAIFTGITLATSSVFAAENNAMNVTNNSTDNNANNDNIDVTQGNINLNAKSTSDTNTQNNNQLQDQQTQQDTTQDTQQSDATDANGQSYGNAMSPTPQDDNINNDNNDDNGNNANSNIDNVSTDNSSDNQQTTDINVLDVLSHNDIDDKIKQLDQAGANSTTTYRNLATYFYNQYSGNPTGKQADYYLYSCANAYRASYQKFHQDDDKTNEIKYLRLLASSFSTEFSARAYLRTALFYQNKKDYPSALYNYNKVIAKFQDSPYANFATFQVNELKRQSNDKDIKISFDKLNNVSPVPDSMPSTSSSSLPKPVQPEPIFSNDTPVDQKGSTSEKLATSTLIAKEDSLKNKHIVVQNIRSFSEQDYSRIVIDLSNNANYEAHWLKSINGKPPRIYIDIKDVDKVNVPQSKLTIENALVEQIRYAKQGSITRFALDAKDITSFNVFQLSSPSRLVIDLSNDQQQAQATTNQTQALGQSDNKGTTKNDKEETNKLPKSATDSLAQAMGIKIHNVVIDPGHGGKDIGTNHNGAVEKDIVLGIGTKVAETFRKLQKGLTVYLTRSTDVFIPLEGRTAFANQRKADIFVSIHANSVTDNAIHGTMTFVLNITRDRTSLEISAAENQASQKAMSDLQGILRSIVLNSKLEESLLLAKSVQNSIVHNVHTTDKGVKQAPFYVLVGARMPAILIETGFVTNKPEADLLSSGGGQDSYAEGIYHGIMNYINNYNN